MSQTSQLRSSGRARKQTRLITPEYIKKTTTRKTKAKKTNVQVHKDLDMEQESIPPVKKTKAKKINVEEHKELDMEQESIPPPPVKKKSTPPRKNNRKTQLLASAQNVTESLSTEFTEALDYLSNQAEQNPLEKKQCFTLPATFQSHWRHHELGIDCSVLVDVIYIDEPMGIDCPQSKLPSGHREFEYFCYDRTDDGQVLNTRHGVNCPPIRRCVFQVVRAVEPAHSPLQWLVGHWFSSPQPLMTALQHPMSGWDALSLVGYPERTLRSMMEDRFPFINHRDFNEFFYQKPNTLVPKILSRDLMACMCRDECNQFDCFKSSSLLKAVTDDQILELENSIKRNASQQGFSDQAETREVLHRVANFKSSQCEVKRPCAHGVQHDNASLEEKMTFYGETNQFSEFDQYDPLSTELDRLTVNGSTGKKRQKRGPSNLKAVDFSLDMSGPWGRRISFVGLGSYEVNKRVKHPWWFKDFLIRTNKIITEQTGLPTNYRYFSYTNAKFITSPEQLTALQKYYRTNSVENDILGVSECSIKAPETLYLVRFELKNDRLAPIVRPFDPDYSSYLYVPLTRDLLTICFDLNKSQENLLDAMTEWITSKTKMLDVRHKIMQQAADLAHRKTENNKLFSDTVEYHQMIERGNLLRQRAYYAEAQLFDSLEAPWSIIDRSLLERALYNESISKHSIQDEDDIIEIKAREQFAEAQKAVQKINSSLLRNN